MSSSSDTRVETILLPAQEQSVRLKLKKKPKQREVKWSEEVEDNEFKPMKTSKKCCIFHRKKRFDESDSESSDDENLHHDENCEHHSHNKSQKT